VARKPRENVINGIYHVYARGNNREAIYLDDADRLLYLRLLGGVVCALRWRCLSYCLMGNHLHLLLETPDGDLSKGVQRIHGRYAQAFNQRHERSGHVFQGRFGAVIVESDGQLAAAAQYIAENPVDAGLCRYAHEWPWSSSYAAAGSRPAWLDTSRLELLLARRPV